jgi:filamentous hemagglutinin family protein
VKLARSLCITQGLIACCFLLSSASQAQVVPDGTLGAERSQVNPIDSTSDRIDGGALRGVSLFHSFQAFNVGEGRGVFFANPVIVQNIFSRVTGGSLSQINGRLGVLGNANLFLLNPNGILFGLNAQLQIAGSFFASTASSFKFGDGSEFSTTNPQAAPLLTVNVLPGLQMGQISAGSTIVNRGNLTTGQDLVLLGDRLDLQGQLVAGRDLRLMGNSVISGKSRFASGGLLQIGGLSGQLANFISLEDPIISSVGDVDIAAGYTGPSLLIESQGSVRIRGDVTIDAADPTATFVGDDAVLSQKPGLIIRSGQSNLVYGGTNQTTPPAFANVTVPTGITIDGPVWAEPNAQGSIVKLSAAKGGISVAGIDVSSSFSSGRQAGSIELMALDDIITGGLIASGGNGNITLSSIQGSINSAGAISSGSSPRGGNIQFFAFGNIKTGLLYAQSLLGDRGGDITLVSKSGSIDTSEGELQTFASPTRDRENARGGNITLSAYGDITTADLLANGRVNPGNIQLTSQTGTINTQKGFVQAAFGDKGTITLSAFNDILTDRISAGSVIGNGGPISLSSTSGSIILTGGLSSTSVIGNGGTISLSARNGAILGSSVVLNTFAVSESGEMTGNGGKVTLEAQNIVSGLEINTVASGGISGEVEVSGLDNLILLNNRILTAQQVQIQPCPNCELITIILNDRGQASNVFVTSNGSLTFNDNLIQGDTRSARPAGNVTIASPSLITFDNSQIISNTSSSGQAGNIKITAGQGIVLTNDSELAARTSSNGKAGDITLDAPLLNITGNAQVLAETSGTGQGGNINVYAPTSVTLDRLQDASPILSVEASGTGKAGSILMNTPSLRLSDLARITATSTNTATNREGGGSITLNASNLYLAGIVGVFAETQGDSPAGTLQLNPYQNQPDLGITLTQNSKISASTSGSGNGGDLIMKAPKSITIAGPGKLAVETSGTGNAGNIEVTTAQLTLKDGVTLSAATTEGSTGQGGNIFLDPKILTIQTRAKIAVDSQGTGIGGSIIADKGHLDRVALRDGGSISAETASANGGNIILTLKEGLLMRRNSQISTSAGLAGAGGNGGNIMIDVPRGFLVAVPNENSDITANAFSGSGGKVTISAAGIYQFTPRSRANLAQALNTADPTKLDPTRLLTNDITAISQGSPTLNGTVTLNTPDVDPSRGLASIPVDLVDPSSMIVRNCVVGSDREVSRFASIGRGGLPPNPNESLSNSGLWQDGRWQDTRASTQNTEKVEAKTLARAAPTEIVEATTWLRNQDGSIKFVVQPSGNAPVPLILTQAKGCHAP